MEKEVYSTSWQAVVLKAHPNSGLMSSSFQARKWERQGDREGEGDRRLWTAGISQGLRRSEAPCPRSGTPSRSGYHRCSCKPPQHNYSFYLSSWKQNHERAYMLSSGTLADLKVGASSGPCNSQLLSSLCHWTVSVSKLQEQNRRLPCPSSSLPCPGSPQGAGDQLLTPSGLAAILF